MMYTKEEIETLTVELADFTQKQADFEKAREEWDAFMERTREEREQLAEAYRATEQIAIRAGRHYNQICTPIFVQAAQRMAQREEA